MGYKSISTSRTTATTAVSKQATIINSSSGFAVAGQSITANTSVSLNVNTPGQAPNNLAAGLSISSINYLNANGSISTANAVSTTSGGNIKINGAGFSSPMTVTVGGTTLANANVTVANATAIIASLGNASPGNVSITAFNSTGSGAQLANAVFYSGVPVWTTTSFILQDGTAANVALVASSDSTLTYTLQAGSTLPTGMSLISTGYISGTPTGYSTNSTSSVVIVATDLENQATQQTITWTVNAADPQFNYVTMLLHGDGINAATNGGLSTSNTPPFNTDASTNAFNVVANGDARANNLSPYEGSYYSNYFAYNATAVDYLVTTSSISLSGDFTVEGYVYWDGVGSNANMFTLGDSSLSTGLEIYISGGNWVMWSNAAQRIAGAAAVLGRWTYIALTRTGTTVTMYINGVSQGTWTSSATFSGTMKIGAEFYASVFYSSMSGYISNFRVNNTTAITTLPHTLPLGE
jgi:hypothetical protein